MNKKIIIGCILVVFMLTIVSSASTANSDTIKTVTDNNLITNDSRPTAGYRNYVGPKVIYDMKDNQNEIVDDSSEDPVPLVDKWAVVIGIADYQGTENDLLYPDDDAIDMYNYLIAKNYPSANIKLLLNSEATASAITSAIDWMNSKEKYTTTTCIFFYSGHGTTCVGNDGDTEAIDEAIVSYNLQLILDGQLRSKFSTYASHKIAFIFDSCFSGGMNDIIGAHVPQTYWGRVVCTACKETQFSWDGDAAMQNGVFTFYYIMGAYIFNSAEGAFNFAAPLAQAKVSLLYGALMNPQKYDTYVGSLYF